MKPKIKKRYLIILFLIAVFLLGPRPSFEVFDGKIIPMDIPLTQIDAYLKEKESKIDKLKDNNEARVVWADGIQKTPYSLVYLHGFSASQEEGAPIHTDFAKRYGCNLYLARLANHGIDDKESFNDLTPKALVESAKEAIAIGKLLGEKVIVMSCSTGGTLSAYLAAHNPDMIDAQIMYSPNIALKSPMSALFTKPWGSTLLKMAIGPYRTVNLPPSCNNYWTIRYRTEALIALQALVEQTMTDATFSKIKQPTFAGYYYKNEDENDSVISTVAIQDFHTKIATPAAQKREHAFPNGTHVLCSRLQAKNLDQVGTETFKFADEVLQLKQPIAVAAPIPY